jgi:hypothetical protein
MLRSYLIYKITDYPEQRSSQDSADYVMLKLLMMPGLLAKFAGSAAAVVAADFRPL